MKKITFLIILASSSIISLSQPTKFSWAERHKASQYDYFNYISSAKDQKDQGPCNIFASVAAVEAMVQIFLNKETPYLDLSESNIFNNTCGLGCGTVTPYALDYIKNTGIVDENCFPYPAQSPYCYVNCSSICQNPAQKVFIPRWDTVEIAANDNTALKKALMDYGPLVVWMDGSYQSQHVGCELHPGDECNQSHAILLIGWDNTSGLEWHIKDSWPGVNPITANIYYNDLNLFNYDPEFYRVRPFYQGDTLECQGNSCTFFENREYYDADHDGFYNWGYDLASKPNGCPGPDFMDFDDANDQQIYRKGTYVLKTPFIRSQSGTICSSGGTIYLDSVPPGWDTVSWEITRNAYCFNTPISGNGSSATIYPNSSCVGKTFDITFHITNNGTASYTETFYVNCPREDRVSISVLDSYGSSPPKYGDTYYLCPFTNYNIYYNNSDTCTTSDFIWTLPYAWTENYKYNNYISINTNDVPDGFLEIWAKTDDCSPSNRIKLMTPYFAAAECEEFFMAYPNPAQQYVDIDAQKGKLNNDTSILNAKFKVSILDKSGTVKFVNDYSGLPFRLDISTLPRGFYYINILYNGKVSSIPLITN